MYIDGILSRCVLKNSDIYFVAVNPNPAYPNTINILMVDLTIPNSPYASLPRICAQNIPAIRTINLALAVPVKDQKAPLAILLPISDFFILLIIDFIFKIDTFISQLAEKFYISFTRVLILSLNAT